MEASRTVCCPLSVAEKRDKPNNGAAVSTIDWESDDDDRSSVFSAPFVPFDDDNNTSFEGEEEAVEGFHAQLLELEQELREHLEFIEGVPSPLRPSLLRQELWSSRLQRDLLWSEHKESVADEQLKFPSIPTPCADPTRHPWYRRIYQDALLECNTLLPAAISLFCHCAAMIAIYDLMLELLRGKLLHFLQHKVSSVSTAFVESGYLDTVYYSCMLCVGLALLHSSGYLYWWLSQRDYFLLKFDAHNRRRGGDFDVRIILWVRKSPVQRLVLYMIGYFMVYFVSDALLSYTFPYFSQQHRLLSHSPSQTFRMDLYDTAAASVVSATPTVLCQRTCSEEIERRQSAFNELLQVERAYTKQVLDKSSYNTYWHIWAYSWGNVYDLDTGEYCMVDIDSTPLFDFAGEIFFAVFFFVLGVAVLRWYGFVFWEKY